MVNAKRVYDRYGPLLQAGAVSTQQLDSAHTSYTVAEARFEAAARQVEAQQAAVALARATEDQVAAKRSALVGARLGFLAGRPRLLVRGDDAELVVLLQRVVLHLRDPLRQRRRVQAEKRIDDPVEGPGALEREGPVAGARNRGLRDEAAGREQLGDLLPVLELGRADRLGRRPDPRGVRGGAGEGESRAATATRRGCRASVSAAT